MTALASLLAGSPYQGYSYAYPHKTAYRPFEPAVPLSAIWDGENRDALFLYLHVPFCEMRCGFCNLFTQTRPKGEIPQAYLQTLKRQALRVRAALGEARFARFAIGGGTPTYLERDSLEALLDCAEQIMGADLSAISGSVETSPATAETAKLELLRARGIDRISIGVQSFIEAETAAAGRPQQAAVVVAALQLIRAAGFPVLNIDLIYGLPGQTVDSWLRSLRAALEFRPEELYLYPLYARPLTALGNSKKAWQDDRLDCYREGRDLLRAEGYEQISMRLFRARSPLSPRGSGIGGEGEGPGYCCQDDGMIGLGCGARSYTRSLHYSSRYAVRPAGIREIIADYIEQSDSAFDGADYGVRLGPDEQRRRWVIQSLLYHDGLSLPAYTRRFGTDVFEDVPALGDLAALALARTIEGRFSLTEVGVERSDTIGPWLYSAKVRTLMESYAWR